MMLREQRNQPPLFRKGTAPKSLCLSLLGGQIRDCVKIAAGSVPRPMSDAFMPQPP
jgi:hypothetical protein